MRLLCMTFPPNKRAQEATEYAQFCKVLRGGELDVRLL